MTQEWPGSTSQKFTTWKKHVEAFVPENKEHPLFSMGAKRHFERKPTLEQIWRSSCRVFAYKDAYRPDRPTGCKKLEPVFPQIEPRDHKKFTGKG